MRTVEQMVELVYMAYPGKYGIEKILREWAEEIVDECADEADLKAWPSETIDITSILKVKEQL